MSAGTLVDASGTALPPGPPRRRIVSLIPSTTELLCRLGLADALVGVTAFCVEPRELFRTRPHVGGQKTPDLERIRALAPDLVIANIEENAREHVDALRAWGVPVWVTYPRSVVDTIRMVRELGALTGVEAAAARLADELEGLRAAAAAREAGRPAIPVFYPIWRGPWMTVSRDTYVHDVLGACGGRSVFADHARRYPVVTLEEAAARRPEVILLPDEPFRFRRAHLADFAAWTDVPAVRDGRIHLVDGKLCAWHGPRLAEALRVLPGLIRGERDGAAG